MSHGADHSLDISRRIIEVAAPRSLPQPQRQQLSAVAGSAMTDSKNPPHRSRHLVVLEILKKKREPQHTYHPCEDHIKCGTKAGFGIVFR